MRTAERCRQTGDILRVAQDVVYVYPYRPLRVVVDAILRHIIAWSLRERGDIFQPRRQLVRKAPEVPAPHARVLLVPVKAGVHRLVPPRIQTRMEAAELILHMEMPRRLHRVALTVKVNRLLLKNRMYVPLQDWRIQVLCRIYRLPEPPRLRKHHLRQAVQLPVPPRHISKIE